MKKDQHNNYILLTPVATDIIEVNKLLLREMMEWQEDNVILNLLAFKNLTVEEVSILIPVSSKHRDLSKSFVIVNEAITYDKAPEELEIVPTLGEAIDTIEMDEITRDLGF